MRFVVPVVLIGLIAFAVPVHAAAIKVVLERGDGHPADHPVDVPIETRRVKVPINVKLVASDMVCVQAQDYKIQLVIDFPYEWSGASPNPESTTITIKQGDPGQGEKQYPAADGSLMLDIFWGENRPKTGASTLYTLTSKTTLGGGGPCAPSATPTEGKVTIPATGADIVPAASGVPPECSKTPDLPGCLESPTVEAKGNSPGFDPMLFSIMTLGVVYTLRRRQA